MLTFAYIPCVSQQPFGGDVSILLPLHRSVPCHRRPGPRGRGGDFFCSGVCERAGRIHPEPEASHVRHGVQRQGLKEPHAGREHGQESKNMAEPIRQAPPECWLGLGGFGVLRGLCRGLWRGRLCGFGFLLRGELLLHLEADGVHVHFVRGGGVAEYLCGVLLCGRV